MKIENVSHDNGLTSIRVEGNVTQSVVSSFGDPFRDQLGVDIYQRTLVVDMGGVDWLDSSGIGWLLSCLKKFRQSGGRLILHSVPAPVHDVFKVLNLQTTFEIVADAAAAESLTRGEPA
jgi:anti-sigma B factor antagonist